MTSARGRPPKAGVKMVQKTIYIEQDKLERLHALSERTRVPVAEYIRQGVERVTKLATIQMDTLEKAGAKLK